MAKPKPNPSRDKAKRAQLSCYTCRQRKVKCDRVKPCSSCVQYQDPDGCRYDISDDKRQPMLMADAYKQLRRENSELKAKEEDCQTVITKCKAENALLKARLAACQIRGLQSSNQSTLSNSQTWLEGHPIPYTSVNVYPDPSKDMCEAGRTSSTFSKSNNLIDGFVQNSALQNSLLPQDASNFRTEGCHESKALSQALEMASVIVSGVQKAREPDDLFLQLSAQDLVTVLSNLPNEFPFTLPVQANPRETAHKTISSQAILVSQTLHSHIIRILSCLGSRSTIGGQHPHGQPIHLTEPLRHRLITSCLVILALFQYLSAQREDPFYNPDSCHQSHAALITISRLDPSIKDDLFQSTLKEVMSTLRKQDIPKLVVPIGDVCRGPVREIDHHGSIQRVKVHKSSLSSDIVDGRDLISATESVARPGQTSLRRDTQEIHPLPWFVKGEVLPEDQAPSTKRFPLSGNPMCHTSTTPYPDLTYTYSQRVTQEHSIQRTDSGPTIIDYDLGDDDTSQASQIGVFPFEMTVEGFGSHYQNPIAQYSHGNGEYLTWKASADQHGTTSERGTDTVGTAVPSQLLNTMVYSTDNAQFTIEDTYTPSVNTSDSSLQTPIQSHPVSPVPTQKQLNCFGSQPRISQYTFEDDRSFANSGHE